MKKWKKWLWGFVALLMVLTILILVLDPLPKFIRHQINSSVEDLGIEGVAVASIADQSIEGIPVRIYNSGEDLKPIIFYIPGGAFIAGNLDTHDNICRYLANSLDVVVLSIEYSKAPEHKFPKGLAETREVLQRVVTGQLEFSYDPSQIILMGDSGGGNFAAVLAQEFKTEIEALVMINPVLDLTPNSPAYQNWGMFVDWYLNDREESYRAEASPLLAKSFANLPYTLVITSEKDPLKEDGSRYKGLLEEARVEIDLKEFQGLGHLANLWAGAAEETAAVREYVVQQVRRVLDR